ncbi:RNA polymerase sigma factor [Algoriphagus sp. SE2]|uniref:RNA polymerase sigma factor n=1 Tax=Algoriphagus sp. SE2 TaxID=3141536 RepID=UPI0031CD3B00
MQDENLWIKEITQGSETALKKLYDSYSTKVFNTVLSYTKNREDAEELLQDIFVTIYNSASTFRKDASVSTWIYRIAVNKSLDFLRKKNSQKRFGLFTSLYKKDSGELAIEQTDFIHPGIKMEQKEDARLLFQVIDTIPENQRTIFILTQIEGLGQKEVAEIMQISRKAVESLLKRAKNNLKKELEKMFPERGK